MSRSALVVAHAAGLADRRRRAWSGGGDGGGGDDDNDGTGGGAGAGADADADAGGADSAAAGDDARQRVRRSSVLAGRHGSAFAC